MHHKSRRLHRHPQRLLALAAFLALLALNIPCTLAAVPFSFGSNRDGKTGLNLDDGGTLIAKPIIATNFTGKSIVDISAGFAIRAHSFLLTSAGEVYTFGSNGSGQTGLGTAGGSTLIATPIDTSNLVGKTVKQAVAGWDYSLLLANDGTVFSFGMNVNGRTGLNTDSGEALIATPINTTNLLGKTITQVDAFGAHSLLLASDGSVFSFGWNSVGQLGQGTITDALIATPINTAQLGGKKITQVSAGADHSLLLADDGTVFSFGSNAGGQTGRGLTGGNTEVPTPIDMTNLAGKRVTQVSAGGLHSLLLTEDGSVFSFGDNSLGATGRGTELGETLIASPISTTNLAGKRIVAVEAGSVHNLLLDANGVAYSFGRNTNGQTGLNTEFASTLIATPIVTTNLTGQRVVKIAAGDAYSLLLAVPEPTSVVLICTLCPFFFIPRRRI